MTGSVVTMPDVTGQVRSPGRRRPVLRWVAVGIAACPVLLALIGPWLAPQPIDGTIAGAWVPAAPGIPLGTDSLGRDAWSRLLAGGSRLVALAGAGALITVALAAIAGLLLGLSTTGAARRFAGGVRWVVSLVSAIPFLLVALVLSQRLPGGWAILIAGLVTSVPLSTLMIADQVRRVAGSGFVEVARGRGESVGAIAVREVLPALRGQLAAELAIRFVVAVQVIATLSVIGYAPAPPAADWAAMIRENLPGIALAPGAVVGPAVAICLVGMSVAALGSMIRPTDPPGDRGSSGSLLSADPAPAPAVAAALRAAPAAPVPLPATPALLDVRDLTVSRPDGTVLVAVPRMVLSAGEVVAISGPSGSGKTLGVLGMLDAVPDSLRATGIRFVDGRRRGPAAMRRWRRDRVGWVSQDPASGVHPLARPIELVAREMPGSRPVQRTAAVAALADVGLVGAVIHRRVDSLSGGQASRVALARAFARPNTLVVIDEPTAALDRACRGELARLVRARHGGPGATVIITHDPEVLHGTGPAPAWPIDRMLQVETAHRADRLREAVPEPVEVGEVVLSVSGLRVARGGRTVVDGLSLTLRRGELVALMGPSGGGKSTVLRAIAGLVPFDGTIRLADRSLGPMTSRDRETLRRIRFVGQDPVDALNPAHRVGGQVARTVRLLGTGSPSLSAASSPTVGANAEPPEAAAARALARLGLAGMESRRPGELSGGQRQRVALARARVVEPDVLLADEITSALDAATAADLLAELRVDCRRGCAVLIATHDPAVAAAADRVVTLASSATLASSDVAVPSEIPRGEP